MLVGRKLAYMSSFRPINAGDLIGREAECGRVDAVVDGIAERGGALVVGGEAGIGKSALLGRAVARAAEVGARAVTTAGVESEARLAFAGLHQLLRPFEDLAERLPRPQRLALAAALGAGDDAEPDTFLVAAAAFGLLCEAAELQPLVIAVDDAQWLDPSTLAALTFTARRAEGEPLVLIAAVRDGFATPLGSAGLPELRVERLGEAAASELLDRDAPDLHPLIRARVLAEAAGNPLALVELARAVSPDAAEHLAPRSTTLTARLEAAFAARLDDVPPDGRALLLAAALDGYASPAELLRAASIASGGARDGTPSAEAETAGHPAETPTRPAGAAPLSAAALDPAVAAGLVELDGSQLRFRHPLIRSAVRQAALPGELQTTYLALADAVADPERALWHRAMAAYGPDEEIAAALEAQAAAARRRGAVGVAAAALERAAALTPDPRRKEERLVGAAAAAYDLGLIDAARDLTGQITTDGLGPAEAAHLAWLRLMISGDVWVQSGATKTFVDLAERMLAGGDPEMALGSLVPIAHRCWWTPTHTRTRRYLVETAEAMPFPPDDPRLLAVIGLAHPEGTGPRIRERLAALRSHEATDPVDEIHLGIAAEKAGDFVTGVRLLERGADNLRESGRLGVLTQGLVHFAWSAVHTGAWKQAEMAGDEAARLAKDTRQPQFGLTGELVAAIAAAHRGTDPDLDARIARPERVLLATSGGPLLAPAHLARGADALGDGRHEDAFRHLWPVFDATGRAFHRFMRWSALLDLVEAGREEHEAEVAAVVAELEEIAARAEPPYLVHALACARPLLAGDDEAEALFAAALDNGAGGGSGYPFLRARTLFSYGRRLRRDRRSADSRGPLREAVDLFDALGATRWSERARLELRATGEQVSGRAPDARDQLTPQELQIARLAAQGLSNREIGERLFLSHRTIGSHLYRIFPKLGIGSRGQLRDALADAQS
jgi:DNA-binding CsgD family transcriptional regulator